MTLIIMLSADISCFSKVARQYKTSKTVDSLSTTAMMCWFVSLTPSVFPSLMIRGMILGLLIIIWLKWKMVSHTHHVPVPLHIFMLILLAQSIYGAGYSSLSLLAIGILCLYCETRYVTPHFEMSIFDDTRVERVHTEYLPLFSWWMVSKAGTNTSCFKFHITGVDDLWWFYRYSISSLYMRIPEPMRLRFDEIFKKVLLRAFLLHL